MLPAAIVKERQQAFLTHHASIDFHRDDAIRFAVDDPFHDVDTENVSLQSLKVCYISIAKASKDGYFCNSSQKVISSISGLSLRTVGNCVRVLRRCGRIEVLHNYKRNKDNQARRIVSYMRLKKFGDWVKGRLDKAYDLARRVKQGLKANTASLFNINKHTGEILPSKWCYLHQFCNDMRLTVFDFLTPEPEF